MNQLINTCKVKFAFLSIAIAISSCLSTQQKMESFVKKFNAELASKMQNEYIEKCEARVTADKNIEIKLQAKPIEDQIMTEIFTKFIPNAFNDILNTDKETKKLIQDGVVFNIKFVDENGKTLSSMNIDKNKLAEFESKNPITANMDSKEGGRQLVIDAMNKSLPIEDKSTGIIINKIDIKGNSLIYEAIVPELYKAIISTEDAKNATKDELKSNKGIKTAIVSLEKFGIENIVYLYKDNKGEEITRISIHKSELQ